MNKHNFKIGDKVYIVANSGCAFEGWAEITTAEEVYQKNYGTEVGEPSLEKFERVVKLLGHITYKGKSPVRNHMSYWSCDAKFAIPEEIYNSPLYKVLQEDE